MTCPRCHAENRDRLRFCEDCGARLTLSCAQCGGELAPGKRFCGSCGAPATGQSAPRPPSPESYTPKHLAEKILTSKAALEGERKQVTVLFADLKGSMELLADRDPEEARKVLDPVLERMMEAVHRYEGRDAPVEDPRWEVLDPPQRRQRTLDELPPTVEIEDTLESGRHRLKLDRKRGAILERQAVTLGHSAAPKATDQIHQTLLAGRALPGCRASRIARAVPAESRLTTAGRGGYRRPFRRR
jgi:class 3 adenylate cyclase